MYSIETIKKFMDRTGELIANYDSKNADDIALCVSTGNRKIGRVMNVSLPAIRTCSNCSGCTRLCYDIKACMQYASCMDARIRNYMILKKDRAGYFARIEAKISRRRTNKFFRWHVAGDIVDLDYFAHMVDIARRHPDFVFWTYTKNYAVVNEYVGAHGGSMAAAIPANLSVMFSEWRGMPLVNPYGFPVFTVRFMDEDERDFRETHRVFHKCPGNCDVCKANGRGCVAGETTYCDEH